MASSLALLVVVGCGHDRRPPRAVPQAPPTATAAETSTATTDAALLAALRDRTFVLTRATVAGELRPLAPGAAVRLVFRGERASLDTGCNGIAGTAVATEGVVELQFGGGSEVLCTGPLGRQDEWLRDVAAAGAAVVLDGERIELRSATTVLSGRERRLARPQG